MPTPTRVLWLDLETTQTDPYHPGACILELGAIITDWSPELREVAKASLLIRPPGGPTDHAHIWGQMDPVVQQMHGDSGLWQQATGDEAAWNAGDADREFANWLDTQTDGPVPLAGSGVGHLDLPMVKVHMPHLAQRITYWPLDIGNVRRMLDLAGRSDLVDLTTDVDAKPHRGLGDVELHVAEARRYLKLLGTIRGGDAAAALDPLAAASTSTDQA